MRVLLLLLAHVLAALRPANGKACAEPGVCPSQGHAMLQANLESRQLTVNEEAAVTNSSSRSVSRYIKMARMAFKPYGMSTMFDLVHKGLKGLAEQVGTIGGGWSEVESACLETDCFILFRRGSQCVFSIAGSNDVKDVINDMTITKVDKCGGEIFEGFWNELHLITTSSVFKKRFLPILSQCGSIIPVGHSMGAGAASVLAECTTTQKGIEDLELGAGIRNKVDTLYLFGGCVGFKVGRSPSRGKRFKGARFYASSWKEFDPIAWLGVSVPNLGYEYIKVPAYNLQEDPWGVKLKRKGTNQKVPTQWESLLKAPSMMMHNMGYLTWLEKLK